MVKGGGLVPEEGMAQAQWCEAGFVSGYVVALGGRRKMKAGFINLRFCE
jgi:hypothetical protein